MLKTYLRALLARFVGKNSTDTQFVGDLDWSRYVNLSSSFVSNGTDFKNTYVTTESGICLISINSIVDGLYIVDETQHVNLLCIDNSKIWPAISCVVAKGRTITFNIRSQTLPSNIQAVFVPFMRAS